MHVM